MKAETILTSHEDRLATWDEVRRATSTTADRLIELCHPEGNYCEMYSDLGGIIRYPAEEFEFFSILSDADEDVAN